MCRMLFRLEDWGHLLGNNVDDSVNASTMRDN
jgi:hypothetical protein